jgi:hypothetical protein
MSEQPVPAIEPITDGDLDEVSRFLHQHLNPRVPQEHWRRSMLQPWAAVVPNHGFLMRLDGEVVGALCAVYSDQEIDGRLEKFCNPHSWCVLDAYRGKSIDLVTRVLRQKGYHFTMLTPNPAVADVFRFFRFRMMDPSVWIAANLPAITSSGDGFAVTFDKEEIAKRLSGTALRTFENHRDLDWLDHVGFGDARGFCHLIYKRRRWKRLPCADLLYVSDPRLFQRQFPRVASHLLVTRRLVWTRAERRLTRFRPRASWETRSLQPKLLLSETLDDSEVQNIYSELVALDL